MLLNQRSSSTVYSLVKEIVPHLALLTREAVAPVLRTLLVSLKLVTGNHNHNTTTQQHNTTQHNTTQHNTTQANICLKKL